MLFCVGDITCFGYERTLRCGMRLLSELGDGVRRRPADEMLVDAFGALLGAELRGVEFEVVDARLVDGLLPALDWFGRGGVGRVVVPTCDAPPLHDHVERAVDADEQGCQAKQAAGAVGQDAERAAVPVVVANIGHDVNALAAVGGDRFVEGGVERRQMCFKIGAFAAGP